MKKNTPHILHVYSVQYTPCEEAFVTDAAGNWVIEDGLPQTTQVPMLDDDGEQIVLDREVTLAFEPDDPAAQEKHPREAFLRAVKVERREHPNTRTWFESVGATLLRTKLVRPKVAA